MVHADLVNARWRTQSTVTAAKPPVAVSATLHGGLSAGVPRPRPAGRPAGRRVSHRTAVRSQHAFPARFGHQGL